MIPRILKNFTVFVNGAPLAGLVEEIGLPDLNLKLEAYRGGGMDADVEIDMGQEAMKATITLNEANETLCKAWGLSTLNGCTIMARGAYRRDSDGSTTPCLVEMRGRMGSFKQGKWKAGDKGSHEHEVSLLYYRLNMGGTDLIRVDVENMIREVDGVDQLADIRAALAL